MSPRTRLIVLPPVIAFVVASLALVTMLVTYTITIPDPLSLGPKSQASRSVSWRATAVCLPNAARRTIIFRSIFCPSA